MRDLKKWTAIVLGAVMVMGSSMTVFAGEGNVTGSGSMEGVIIKNPVIQVKVPVQADVDVDYIADPKELIKETASGDVTTGAGSALRDDYAGMSFKGDKGIYFKTTSGDYTDATAPMNVINKSVQDVTVTVKLEADNSGDASISIAPSEAALSGDARSLYFAIDVSGDASGDTSSKAITAIGASGAASFESELAGTPAFFDTEYDASGDYVKVMKDDKSGDAGWQTAVYTVKGAANKAGDWGENNKLAVPGLKLTWSFADASEAGNTVRYSGTGDLDIPFSSIGISSTDTINDAIFDWGNGQFTSPNVRWGGDRTDAIVIGSDKVTVKRAGILEWCSGATVKLYVVCNEDDSNPVEVTIVCP